MVYVCVCVWGGGGGGMCGWVGPPTMSLLTCPVHGNLGRGQAAMPAASLEQVCGSGICLCVRVRVWVGGCVGGWV